MKSATLILLYHLALCCYVDVLLIVAVPLARYLVDQKWLKQWKKYVGFDAWEQFSAGKDSANPGPVDNSNLFKCECCT